MIARAGTCVTLSLAIVVVACIVLHRPDRPRAGLEVRSGTASKSDAKAQTPVAPASPKPSGTAKSSSQVPANRPKAAFDRVRDGETFADVARRVYGDGADLEAFWKVNRDQLASTGAEVRPGMVLRTPAL